MRRESMSWKAPLGINCLVDWLQNALTPHELVARPILALPTRNELATVWTGQGGIRNVFVEGTHVRPPNDTGIQRRAQPGRCNSELDGALMEARGISSPPKGMVLEVR